MFPLYNHLRNNQAFFAKNTIKRTVPLMALGGKMLLDSGLWCGFLVGLLDSFCEELAEVQVCHAFVVAAFE